MSKRILLAISASALMFAACGDDVTEVNENSYIAVLEPGEKLSTKSCDSTNVGELLFVKDSSTTFVCDGDGWFSLKGEDGIDGRNGKDGKNGTNGEDGSNGTSCSAKSVQNKAKTLDGIEVTCGKTVIDTIWNGVDGKNGEDGEDGSNGTSCSAKSVQNKAKTLDGIEVICGETVIDTIWNGKNGDNGSNGVGCTAKSVQNKAKTLDGIEVTCGKTVIDTIWNGKNGDNGSNGVGCTLKDDGKGKVTVTCGDDATTLYKAMCGSNFYDPEKSYCWKNELYTCNNKPYIPTMSFCLESEIYDLCEGTTYDPAKYFCSENVLYSCNNKPYNPATSYCWENEIYDFKDKSCDSDHATNIGVVQKVDVKGSYKYVRCGYNGSNFGWGFDSATKEDFENQDEDSCDPSAIILKGEVGYVCEDSVTKGKAVLYYNWRTASEYEVTFNEVCSENVNRDKVIKDGTNYFRCEKAFSERYIWSPSDKLYYYVQENDVDCDLTKFVEMDFGSGPENYVCNIEYIIKNKDETPVDTIFSWRQMTQAEQKAGVPCNSEAAASKKTINYGGETYACAFSYYTSSGYKLAYTPDDYEYFDSFYLTWFRMIDNKTKLQ